MADVSLLYAIRQLTDMRTELLLYKEAEKQRVLADLHRSTPHLDALEKAEKAIRYAALVWLMDVAQRVTTMAQDMLGEMAESLNSQHIAHTLMGDLISAEDMQHMPELLSAHEIESHFMRHVQIAADALRGATEISTTHAIPLMMQQLESSARYFNDYLTAPEECIAALIGSSSDSFSTIENNKLH